MRAKFRDIVNKTAFDLELPETQVNFIVRYHWNKIFELYNSLEFWTIYIENVGTIWTTAKKAQKYIDKLNRLINLLETQPERFTDPEGFNPGQLPLLKETVKKVEILRDRCVEDRYNKKGFTKIKNEGYEPVSEG